MIRILHTVVYASKITMIFFLGNTNHSILFLYILVIVCAYLTSNAVIFKRLSKGLQIYTSLLIDFCNDYRPCWQVSCILFSKIISSANFNLSKSLIPRGKQKNKSPATTRPAYVCHHWTAYLSNNQRLCKPTHSYYWLPEQPFWLNPPKSISIPYLRQAGKKQF